MSKICAVTPNAIYNRIIDTSELLNCRRSVSLSQLTDLLLTERQHSQKCTSNDLCCLRVHPIDALVARKARIVAISSIMEECSDTDDKIRNTARQALSLPKRYDLRMSAAMRTPPLCSVKCIARQSVWLS